MARGFRFIVMAIEFAFTLGAFLVDLSCLISISNANDVTIEYGEAFTPIVLKAVKAAKVILDGELIVWDSVANKFEAFGNLKSLARNRPQQDPGESVGKHLCCSA